MYAVNHSQRALKNKKCHTVKQIWGNKSWVKQKTNSELYSLDKILIFKQANVVFSVDSNIKFRTKEQSKIYICDLNFDSFQCKFYSLPFSIMSNIIIAILCNQIGLSTFHYL